MIWTLIITLVTGVQISIEVEPDVCLAAEAYQISAPAAIELDDGSRVEATEVYCLPPDPCECVAEEAVE